MQRRRAPLSAETITHTYDITPNDPYDLTMLEFSVLASRGYPVSLQPANRAQIQQARTVWSERMADKHVDIRNHYAAMFEYHAQWVIPSVHHSDMRVIQAYRGGLDAMVFETPDDVEDVLDEHPAMKLVKPVSDGHPGWVHRYHRKLQDGHTPVTARPIDVLGFTGGCLVKAAERARTPGVGFISEGHFFSDYDPAKYQRFAQKLTERGIRPIGTEALAGLINDYYALAEQLMPDFAAQKELQPHIPPQPPLEY